jgi:hypothetical protein
MDWSHHDLGWVAYTVDKYGMQALHTKIPKYNHQSGKWSGDGVRHEIGLTQIHHEFNAATSLVVRPKAKVETKPDQKPINDRRAKVPVPPDAATPTPVEHLVATLPEPPKSAPNLSILAADMALLICDLTAGAKLNDVDRRRISSIQDRLKELGIFSLPLIPVAARKPKPKARRSAK